MYINPEIWTLVRSGETLRLLEEVADSENLTLRTFRNVAEAINLEEPREGLILVIDSIEKFNNYLTIIKRFQKNFFALDVIVFGKEKPPEVLDRENEIGVDLYIMFPIEIEDFFVRLTHLITLRRLKSSVKIIGRSRGLNEILETVLLVSPTDVSVFIEGESGSGKELIARAIHTMSRRAGKHFEAVNCGALAEGILESELFGHEKGSFTGAVARRRGLFERANGGTILLDEVGEMSLNMQVRLLRVIETGDFMRVGGIERVHTDVRLIAATNRALETAIKRGEFRKDLYYRLKVVRIYIPPLRARSQDIPFLVHYFIRQSSKKHGKKIKGVEREGMELLTRYSWPGNVRELSNMIDSLMVLSKASIIKAADIEHRLQETTASYISPDLPVHVKMGREEMERELILNSLLSLHNDVREILGIIKGGGMPSGSRWGRWVEVQEAPPDEPSDLSDIEREAIREALIANKGNRRKTSRQLGISERTLYRRLKAYKF